MLRTIRRHSDVIPSPASVRTLSRLFCLRHPLCRLPVEKAVRFGGRDKRAPADLYDADFSELDELIKSRRTDTDARAKVFDSIRKRRIVHVFLQLNVS
ncbi:hypothetical protein RVU70_17865 [Methylocystis echinoides]